MSLIAVLLLASIFEATTNQAYEYGDPTPEFKQEMKRIQENIKSEGFAYYNWGAGITFPMIYQTPKNSLAELRKYPEGLPFGELEFIVPIFLGFGVSVDEGHEELRQDIGLYQYRKVRLKGCLFSLDEIVPGGYVSESEETSFDVEAEEVFDRSYKSIQASFDYFYENPTEIVAGPGPINWDDLFFDFYGERLPSVDLCELTRET